MNYPVIRTSEPNWFPTLAKHYKKRTPFLLVDDANTGIDLSESSLLEIGGAARLSLQQWAGVLTSLGLGAAGIWIIRLAIVDPEPTSKLSLLIGGGLLCVLTGGGYATYILTNRKPPSVKLGKDGVTVTWA